VLCEWTSYERNGIIVVFDGSSQCSVHRPTGVNCSHTYRINTRLSFRSSLSMLSLLRAMTNFRRFTNDTIMTIIHNSATQTSTAVTATWHCATHWPTGHTRIGLCRLSFSRVFLSSVSWSTRILGRYRKYFYGRRMKYGRPLYFHAACDLLWPPCVADTDIILLPCGFFVLLFLFPRLISAVADWMYHVYHTSTHGVALVRI